MFTNLFYLFDLGSNLVNYHLRPSPRFLRIGDYLAGLRLLICLLLLLSVLLELVALAQVHGLHQELFLQGVSLHVRDPYVPLHVCEDDRLENSLGLTLQAKDLPHVWVGAVPVPQQRLPLFYQELLKLAGGGRGEFVRQEVRQLLVGEATLQEGRPFVIVGVGKVHLRDTICC
jgi:hypothetical protein